MPLRKIVIDCQLFQGKEDTIRSVRAICWLMYGLVRVNLDWLEAYQTPSLYSSGVLYKLEANSETWQDIPTVIRHGFGDCEDLACWRAAELQYQGIAAMPFVSWRTDGKRRVYHALVKLPDGRIEDPSRALGMHGHPITRAPVYIDAQEVS